MASIASVSGVQINDAVTKAFIAALEPAIAGVLNRQGRTTACGHRFDRNRGGNLRRHWNIPAFPETSRYEGDFVTVRQAAVVLGVAASTIHRLQRVKRGELEAAHVMRGKQKGLRKKSRTSASRMKFTLRLLIAVARPSTTARSGAYADSWGSRPLIPG